MISKRVLIQFMVGFALGNFSGCRSSQTASSRVESDEVPSASGRRLGRVKHERGMVRCLIGCRIVDGNGKVSLSTPRYITTRFFEPERCQVIPLDSTGYLNEEQAKFYSSITKENDDFTDVGMHVFKGVNANCDQAMSYIKPCESDSNEQPIVACRPNFASQDPQIPADGLKIGD